ncbi:hypothetical protein OHA79_39475 [Streptomyces sp. NBC_00841]|uniref:carbohydrate-binding protein n=1 Tax=unclassified Streptomyces TaxID=2593676 RepID=UPI0022549771|nr:MULTISPECIES: carbohydrate-binding protein [unclassified Streptomyces]MCX4530882.1 hypothetical protein [Streptomyces sp. NBC_01669]WSA03371.1 hypothetical protein OHA79_39475 [Streptomyces sp. NBC_00841]
MPGRPQAVRRGRPGRRAFEVRTTASPRPPSGKLRSAAGGGGGTCPVAWSSGTSYAPGNVVSYAGHKYTATYYSTGAVPNGPSSWAVWRDDGVCA